MQQRLRAQVLLFLSQQPMYVLFHVQQQRQPGLQPIGNGQRGQRLLLQ